MERGAGLMGELLLGWPAMLVMAFLAGGERWRWRRRRATLNRCLHELRRPLQRIAIEQRPQGGAQIRHIHLLIDALCDLDDAVNGGSHRAPRARLVTVGSVLEDLRRRWGRLVTVENGPEDLVSAEWILADSVGIARALDNLVMNGLEHGRGTVRIEALAHPGRVRIRVADHPAEIPPPGDLPEDASPGAPALASGADPRRGHGLELAASLARSHGGRLWWRFGADGGASTLELPCASEGERAGQRG